VDARRRLAPVDLYANGSAYPTANAFYRYNSGTLPASQGAPYNYYSSTSALWKLFPDSTTPRRQCSNSPQGPCRRSAHRVRVRPFSSASPVVWQWSPTDRQWLRFYNTQPDDDPSGQQLHATNVVIQMVQTRRGPTTRAARTARTSRASRTEPAPPMSCATVTF